MKTMTAMDRMTATAGLALLVAGFAHAEVLYVNDFTGAAGGAIADSATVGSNLTRAAQQVAMDGTGRLVPTTTNFWSKLRVQLGEEPLNEGNAYGTCKLIATLSAPTNSSWIGVGFSLGPDNLNKEGGPWIQVNSSSLRLRGGKGASGTMIWEQNSHAPGEVLKIEMAWHTNRTAVLSLNDVPILEGVALEYDDGAGGTVTPIQYLNLQFASQPTDGSAYFDSISVEGLESGGGYAAFAELYGMTGAPLSAPYEDFDGDGLLNIHEYALGGNPTNSSDTGSAPEFDYDTNGMVRFSNVILTDAAADIAYVVEKSTNLAFGVWDSAGWHAVNTNASALSGFDELEHLLDGSALDRLFIRLRITQD